MTGTGQPDGPVATVLVVGCSRGLGAALVDGLLHHTSYTVLGLSRTPGERIPDLEHWTASGRFHYLCADIGAPEVALPIQDWLAATSPSGRLMVILNAACIDRDVRDDATVDYPVWHRVNRVAVTGLGHLLEAVEAALLHRGGVLVGISSINALKPPVVEMRLAYAPGKAYLDMTWRVLDRLWGRRVRLVTVHLGRIEGSPGGGPAVLRKPSYAQAAAWLLDRLLTDHPPRELTYPLPYRIFYRWLLPAVPDRLYCWLIQRLLRV
ncbi:MAG: SDR family oxidoreductase [Magnetococcales bacterium]|nr:SDR family oxidoreductase [Magnetococcales bacterium]